MYPAQLHGSHKILLKTVETEGTSFEDSFAAFKYTRNGSGFSPNQLFFLRNLRDHRLPSLIEEPNREEMARARDRVRAARGGQGGRQTGSPP